MQSFKSRLNHALDGKDFDRLLILCLAIALALAILVVWFYPLPKRSLDPCALAGRVSSSSPVIKAAASDQPASSTLTAVDSSPTAGATAAAHPGEHKSSPPTGATAPSAEGLMVIRHLLAQYLPNSTAIDDLTYDKFSHVHDIYHRNKQQWNMVDADLKQVCLEHVKEWGILPKLKLASKYTSFMKVKKQELLQNVSERTLTG